MMVGVRPRSLSLSGVICALVLVFIANASAFAPLSRTGVQRHERQTQPQHRHYPASTTALGAAKSGGRLIKTVEEFETTVLAKDSPKPVLAFFSAPWCGPCRLTNPVVKEIMKQYAGDIDVVELCTDDLAEVASTAGVTSIPTIQFYHSGKIMDTIVGCVAKSVLANAVEKVLEDVKVSRTPPSSSSS